MTDTELRELADVVGVIKTSYVEPVEDKALLSQAITVFVSLQHSCTLVPVTISVVSRGQRYRDKRISAHGGCLGDYRR